MSVKGGMQSGVLPVCKERGGCGGEVRFEGCGSFQCAHIAEWREGVVPKVESCRGLRRFRSRWRSGAVRTDTITPPRMHV